MQTSNWLLTAALLASLTTPSACGRSSDPDPPIIPVPGAKAVASANADPGLPPPALAPSAVDSAAAEDPAPPEAPGPASGPAPAKGPSGTPFSSPLPFPWPFPAMSALPPLPVAIPKPPGLPPGIPWPGANPTPGGSPAKGQKPGTPGAVQPESQAQVIVYGTTWCPACKHLKQDLNNRRVPYTFIDIEDNKARESPHGQKASDKPKSMSNGVPQTRVTKKNGQVVWIQGADGARIEREYRS